MSGIKETRKQGWLTILAIAIIGVAVYLGFTPLYELVPDGVPRAVISSSFGAIFVIVLTMYLLNKQTEIEQESKRGERVFDEKVGLYKEILSATEKMLEDGIITGGNEMRKLPFLMLRLQMLGNDEAIKAYQKIFNEINNLFLSEPDNEEVEINEEASLKIFEYLSEFSNTCRIDLKVSDKKINTELFKLISNDLKKTNEIILGGVNKHIGGLNELFSNSDLNLKTIAHDYVAWQLQHWPKKVEYQIVSRQRKKVFFVHISAEQKSGRFVADRLKDLLPVFQSKFPDYQWEVDEWYSNYTNRLFTQIDINKPEQAVSLYKKIIQETQDLVDEIVLKEK